MVDEQIVLRKLQELPLDDIPEELVEFVVKFCEDERFAAYSDGYDDGYRDGEDNG